MPDHYVCHVYSHEKATFHSKKEIKVPADVKGVKVRTANQTIANFVTSMGGNSVQVPIMEAYETLKRGITEAITVPWDGLTHPAFKFGEVTTYTLDVPIYVSNFTHGISRTTYNGLSDAQKKAVDSVCTPEWSRLVYKHWYEDGIKREDDVRKSDRKLTKVSPDEVKLWREAAKPVYEAWADGGEEGRLRSRPGAEGAAGRAPQGRRPLRRRCRFELDDTAPPGSFARRAPPGSVRELPA